MKTYFNDAIIGNSKMLGCLTNKGELVRLYWPNIDFRQQIGTFKTGINVNNNTYWTAEDFNFVDQYYETDTNIVNTILENPTLQLKVTQKDFILMGSNTMVRKFTIENESNNTINPNFVLYSETEKNFANYSNVMIENESNLIVHYSHKNYMGITFNLPISSYQLGDCYDNAKRGELSCDENIMMWYKLSAMCEIGEIKPNEAKEVVVYIYLADGFGKIKSIMQPIQMETVEELEEETRNYWHQYLSFANKAICTNEKICSLYKRSILMFALVSDEEYGGVIASPEVDEEFSRCGRYAYCWPRDAAFVTFAFDVCGLYDLTDKFFKWCSMSRALDGLIQQRYYVDGSLAPCWGLQIDEPSTVIYGIWQHYKTTKDKEFLRNMSRYVITTAKYLIGFLKENYLPCKSYDIWEERKGVHAYSTSALCRGFKDTACILNELEIEKELADQCEELGEKVKNAIVQAFWVPETNSFKRSVYLKEDWKENMPDVSLIGLAYPFEVFSVTDEKIVNTVNIIEKELLSEKVGGIKRYKDDEYIGGNPWIIATLWLSIYYSKAKNREKAKEYFEWAVEHTTRLGFFPEQIDKNTGEPAWVMQLTWSHAMFIIALNELKKLYM